MRVYCRAIPVASVNSGPILIVASTEGLERDRMFKVVPA
jgi:hypothetical protein